MKTVSVVMPTYNSQRTLRQALESLKEQDYKGKVEIIVADGGSKDGTLEILKEMGVKVIAERSGSPEKAKALALQQARGELVLMMASDNMLTSKGWLKQMVQVLEKEKEVVAVYSWRYEWRKKDSSLNRYLALLGANDPVAWWLRKADRQEYGSDKWKLMGKAEDKGDYFKVEFSKDKIPTLGDNGFLVRRKELMKARVEVKDFYHVDVGADLVRRGKNKFGVVKNTIIHDTGETWGKLLVKRYRYMKELYLKEREQRRYLVFDPSKEMMRLVGYVVYSLTLVGPIMRSVKGYIDKRDGAWWWHPVMCVSMVGVYGVAVIENWLEGWGK